jgi:hypothetical protein
MPPRYAYWTIIAGGLPTAFRAADRDELLPTFHRIKEKHPDAQMKYFARGKLWESRDAANAAEKRRDTRSRDWRPGGNHRDPRQKFIDAKKRRNAAMRKLRWERRNTSPPTEQKPWVRKRWMHGQATEEPAQPPRPRGPNREPKPSENPDPTPPPRADQPSVPPPGPPERGSPRPRRQYRPRDRFSKGPRR